MRQRNQRAGRLAIIAAGLAGTALISGDLQAGGTIGWAEAVSTFSDEGIAVGDAAVRLGIIAVGAILMCNMTGLVGTITMFGLGAALMAGADTIGTSLFQGGAGGGSILATSYAESALAAEPTPMPR